MQFPARIILTTCAIFTVIFTTFKYPHFKGFTAENYFAGTNLTSQLPGNTYTIPNSQQYPSCITNEYQNPYLDYDNFPCDPYLEPGRVTLNPGKWTQSFWTSFNPKCPRAPQFMQDVIDRKQLPWLLGKTVLVLGDLVDYRILLYMCRYLVYKNDGAMFTHWPKFPFNTTSTEETDSIEVAICTIKEYDVLLMWIKSYVTFDDDPLNRGWGGPSIPATHEERIPLYKDVLDAFNKKPDMIILGGGAWELESWARSEADKHLPVQTNVDPSLLEHWIRRAPAYVDTIENTFPDTFTSLRMAHFNKVEWGTSYLPDDVAAKNSPRAPYHQTRVIELNSVYAQLMKERPQVYKFSWGQLLSGRWEEFPDGDDIYPGADAAMIYGDMILYYINRLKSKN